MTISSSADLTYSNIFSQSHANIYNLINNRSNVPNPVDSLGTRKFVYTREPRDLGISFTGFPVIIIPPIEQNQKNLTVDATKSTVNLVCRIVVIAVDVGGPRNATATGAEQLDTISNNILKTLNDKTNRSTLRNQGMKNFQVNSSPAEYEEGHDQMLFIREFTITYSQVLEITA